VRGFRHSAREALSIQQTQLTEQLWAVMGQQKTRARRLDRHRHIPGPEERAGWVPPEVSAEERAEGRSHGQVMPKSCHQMTVLGKTSPNTLNLAKMSAFFCIGSA
jgi:hypothetical protein